MHRDGSHRLGPEAELFGAHLVGRLLVQHQHRLDGDGAVGAGTDQHLAEKVVGGVRRVVQHAAAAGAEHDVGDQAEEVVFLAGDLHKPADANVFDRACAFEARREALGERPLDDEPEPAVMAYCRGKRASVHHSTAPTSRIERLY